jgi:hypothetical protein
MSKIKRDNRKHVPELLVGYTNTALVSAGALVGTGTALNITNGALGLVSWDFNGSEPMGDFMQAGDAATVEYVKIVQGTPLSGSLNKVRPWETADMAYVSSDIISRRQVRSFSAMQFKAGQLGAHAFSGFATPANETLYKAYAHLYSVRMDRDYGDNDNVVAATFTTPDYTALNTAEPLDHLLQNLAVRFNANSKLVATSNPSFRTGNKDFIVLGVNLAGGDGTVIGSLVCGDIIDVMTDSGTLYGVPTTAITTSITVDAPLIRALASVINAGDANITATSTIETLDLTTAGTTAAVDALIFVSLEEDTAAYFDDIAQTIPRIEVGLSASFATAGPVDQDLVAPEEPIGSGRQLKIMEDNQSRIYRHTMQKQPYLEYFSEGVTYIDPTKNYNMYIIDYFEYEPTLTTVEHYPKQLVIVVPVLENICTAGDDVSDVAAYTTFADWYDTTAVSAATITSLESILGAWLKSANTVSPFSLHGNATSSVYFA